MKEILITSSALVLALLALRALFRNRIPRRVQYALWGLVLVRLLVPFNLPAAEHSVLTAAEPAARNLESVYLAPRQVTYWGQGGAAVNGAPDVPAVALGPAAPDNALTFSAKDGGGAPVEAVGVYQRQIALADLLRPVWYGGMIVTSLWFGISNLRFRRKLRRGRTGYPAEDCRYPVYLVESGLSSPCLFGLFRPAVYVTPAAVSSPERLRHVLAHETTHGRHGDLLWSLLRCVCLVIYWFDPLVWIAAAASRRDCELACDEGALADLGEGERLAYGKTLLSLIPVRRGPENPLLTATTMTSGKRQLKDRITRIAENRKCTAAALIAVILLVCAACGATFTGGASQKEDDRTADEPVKAEPLTAEELHWFNTAFFNSAGTPRNQFLTSTYEKPEEIDLYQLFYNGTGTYLEVSEAERRAVVRTYFEGVDPGVDLTKCPAGDMDRVLRENTGLGLEETEKRGLDSFYYREDYDAYYNFHGDTNAVPEVSITAGEREGDLVTLYYEDVYRDGGWKRVVLRGTEEDGYRFVSHLPCQRPAIGPVYPESEPWRIIPLTDLEPHETAVIETERRSKGDIQDLFYWLGGDDGYDLYLYRDYSGSLRAALSEGQDLECFLETSNTGEFTADWYEDLCGFSGFSVVYPMPDGTIRTAFYYFDGQERLRRLVDGDGMMEQADLDGDGQMELVWREEDRSCLLFRRDGQVYLADLRSLLKSSWPEMAWWDYAFLDREGRCIRAFGFVRVPAWGKDAQADFLRLIYFDGENLRIYTDLSETEDHAAVNISDRLPEAVRKDALAASKTAWEKFHSYFPEDDPVYDDWRLASLELVNTYTEFPIGTVEVYCYDWQAHAAEPTKVALAGGMYLREDGWMGGVNIETGRYLVYRVTDGGQRERLADEMNWDYSPDSVAYRADLCRTILCHGPVLPEAFSGEDHYIMLAMDAVSYLGGMSKFPEEEQQIGFDRLAAYIRDEAPLRPDGGLFAPDYPRSLEGNPYLTMGGAQSLRLLLASLNGEAAEPEEALAGAWANQVLAEIVRESEIVMDLDTAGTGRGGGRYCTSPALGNGPNRVLGFQNFQWSWAGEEAPAGPSLTVSAPDGTSALTFWQGSDLVRCVYAGETRWLRAEEPDPADVFARGIFPFMRFWYDEAEESALRGDIVIPDRGQSRLEIAQSWAEQSCRADLLVTPGSKYACTYVSVKAEVDQWAEMPETSYPSWTEGKERFWFGYTRAFVPENQESLNWQMAGNTGSYTGDDPAVPAGAFENRQVGVLYRTEEGWRCKETGTGP